MSDKGVAVYAPIELVCVLILYECLVHCLSVNCIVAVFKNYFCELPARKQQHAIFFSVIENWPDPLFNGAIAGRQNSALALEYTIDKMFIAPV